jgi:hypothetical protein
MVRQYCWWTLAHLVLLLLAPHIIITSPAQMIQMVFFFFFIKFGCGVSNGVMGFFISNVYRAIFWDEGT